MKVNIVKFDYDTETPTEICVTNIIDIIMCAGSFRLSYDKQKVFFCYITPKNPEPISAYISMSELERVKKILGEQAA